jgi:hypothetical protein
LRRSVTYLETRNDLNHEKFGFFAIRWHGQLFLILATFEPRFEPSPLEWRLRHLQGPEDDPHRAPRRPCS